MQVIQFNGLLSVSGSGEQTQSFIAYAGGPAVTTALSVLGSVIGGPVGTVAGTAVGLAANEAIRQNSAKIDKVLNDAVFSEPVKDAMTGVNLFSKFVLGW